MNQEIDELELFGFSYGRDDHHLANLFIMKNFSNRIKMKMYTDRSLIFASTNNPLFYPKRIKQFLFLHLMKKQQLLQPAQNMQLKIHLLPPLVKE